MTPSGSSQWRWTWWTIQKELQRIAIQISINKEGRLPVQRCIIEFNRGNPVYWDFEEKPYKTFTPKKRIDREMKNG